MPYTIQINEYQRNMLSKLMRASMSNIHFARHLMTEKGSHYDTMYEEATALLDMFADLPAAEQDEPGITHGLCP